MRPISLTTPVDAPRERVFDLISDLSTWPSWTDHFISDYRLERMQPTGVGAGARFRVDAPAGIGFMNLVLTELERPHLIVQEGRGGRSNRIPVKALWELTEGPSGVTEVDLTFWMERGGLRAHLPQIRATRWWRRRWARALRRLQEVVESGDDAPAPVRVAGGDRQLSGIA